MERRQIAGSLCTICSTVGGGAMISTATNHLSWLLQAGGASLALGLGGFGVMLITGPQRPAEPAPDMPIREVFFYLDHNVLKAKPDHWTAVGKNLRDRLSTDRLSAWGRKIGQGNAHSRQRAALERIEATDWAKADWTYWFFDTGLEMSTHVIVSNGLALGNTEWADLQFSRAQIMKLIPWPQRLWRRAKWPAADAKLPH